eukprot:scaffold28171_cov19-Tisochrysis_lutea.AAC.1
MQQQISAIMGLGACRGAVCAFHALAACSTICSVIGQLRPLWEALCQTAEVFCERALIYLPAEIFYACHAPVACSIAFSANSRELWAVAETNRLDRYELLEGQLLQQ